MERKPWIKWFLGGCDTCVAFKMFIYIFWSSSPTRSRALTSVHTINGNILSNSIVVQLTVLRECLVTRENNLQKIDSFCSKPDRRGDHLSVL